MVKAYYVHASYNYSLLGLKDYLSAARDIYIARLTNAENITFHFPLELVLASKINKSKGIRYVNFVENLAKILNVMVVWENVAYLSTKDWSLIEQATWEYIPKDINLCLDTGHLILGEKKPRERIRQVLKRFGGQIKHLHIHENDLIRDLHLSPTKIIDKKLFEEIVRGRTWIIESPS